MNILVGVSGGVDSAVALNILKSEGHSITGAMMKIYNGKTLTLAASCYGGDKKQDIEDAENVCKSAECDFHLIDLSKEYDELVFQNFKNLYLKGLTPNPCVMCNKLIKFGLFVEKAKEVVNFEKFATGHYARNEFNEKTGMYELKKGINPKKDQTYFLSKLTQNDLKNIIFPLGNMTKEDVREYAINHNLVPAQKRESQDFYKGEYKDLFNIEPQKGDITDRYGNILGHHEGIFNYTIGKRKGLKIAHSEPLYVIEIDANENRIIVGTKNETIAKGLYANNVNWVSIKKQNQPFEATAKIRSASNPVDVIVYPEEDKIKVEFREQISSIAPGQAVVVYRDDVVLLGATIESSF